MKDKQKKLKAAIMGVLYYLQEQEEEQKKVKDTSQWVLSGRKIIMRNREYVQRRGFLR